MERTGTAMSYDLTFIRRAEGQSFEEAFAASEERVATMDPSPLFDAEKATWTRLAARCRSILGPLTVEEHTRYADAELTVAKPKGREVRRDKREERVGAIAPEAKVTDVTGGA